MKILLIHDKKFIHNKTMCKKSLTLSQSRNKQIGISILSDGAGKRGPQSTKKNEKIENEKARKQNKTRKEPLLYVFVLEFYRMRIG